jgi:hypothetical protein
MTFNFSHHHVYVYINCYIISNVEETTNLFSASILSTVTVVFCRLIAINWNVQLPSRQGVQNWQILQCWFSTLFTLSDLIRSICQLVVTSPYCLKLSTFSCIFLGIEYLYENGLLQRTPEDVAQFLHKGEGLSKTAIGDYLGERSDFNEAVLRAFVELHDFTDLILVQALR